MAGLIGPERQKRREQKKSQNRKIVIIFNIKGNFITWLCINTQSIRPLGKQHLKRKIKCKRRLENVPRTHHNAAKPPQHDALSETQAGSATGYQATFGNENDRSACPGARPGRGMPSASRGRNRNGAICAAWDRFVPQRNSQERSTVLKNRLFLTPYPHANIWHPCCDDGP